MPTTLRSLAPRVVIVAVAAVVALGGCSLLPPGTVPEPLNRVVVGFETFGGECPDGPCGFTAEIHGDGTVTRSDGLEQTVDAAAVARLVRDIDAAD